MSSSPGLRAPLAARLRTALVATTVTACAVASGTLGAAPSGPPGPSGTSGEVVEGALRSDVRGVALPTAGSPVVLPAGKVAGSGVTRPVRGAGAAGGEDVGSIPPVALLAYQRADTVLAEAAPECGVPWNLLAGVGRVESDHGRLGGAEVDEDGVSRPAVVGTALDGTGGTSVVRDTDAGQVDGDAVWDRAVGPMQLLPSTWSVVAVDGDADGERSPDDIDDAALAAAVFLCSDRSGLDSRDDVRAALLRYNRSRAYVSLVMSYARGYAASAAPEPFAPSPEVRALAAPPASSEPGAGGDPGVPGQGPRRDGSANDSGDGVRAGAAPAPAGPVGGGGAPTDAPGTQGPSAAPSSSATASPTAQETTPGAAPPSSAGPAPETGAPPPGTATPAPETGAPPETATPEPSATPTPVPAPSPQVVEGLWTECGPGRCLDAQPLVLGIPDPVCEINDYDGDGVAEPTSGELDGLVGQTVALTVLPDPAGWLVLEIRGLTWISSTAPQPSVAGCSSSP